MARTTSTLTLTEDQLYVLLNALEGEWTDHMTEEQLKQHDKLHARIARAINRID